MATYLVVLSGFNEAIAIDDWIRILKEAVSLKVVRCIAVGTIDHLGFLKFFKINFFRTKIASALKGPIWTVPIIKYGTNCYGRLFKKLWFEEFFFLRIFRWINSLGEQSTWAWPFLTTFYGENYFSVWQLLCLCLCLCRHDQILCKQATFNLGLAQMSNFFPMTFSFRLPDIR